MEFFSAAEQYRAELLKTAMQSPAAENRPGTPVILPEDPDAQVNLPENAPENDPLQSFPRRNITYETFLAENTAAGFLRVQAFAGPGALPIPDADVLVVREFTDGARRFAAGKTDVSGILDGIVLPAPDAALAQQPGAKVPYALYDIYVTHPDYRTEIYRQVPVFAGVRSIQPVRFIARRAGL